MHLPKQTLPAPVAKSEPIAEVTVELVDKALCAGVARLRNAMSMSGDPHQTKGLDNTVAYILNVRL